MAVLLVLLALLVVGMVVVESEVRVLVVVKRRGRHGRMGRKVRVGVWVVVVTAVAVAVEGGQALDGDQGFLRREGGRR